MLRELQLLLGRVNGIEPGADVRDFVTTDADTIAAVEGPDGRKTAEKLLLIQEGNTLEIALFFDAQVLERLSCCDPLKSLGPENLADFCLVLEGISHFNYVIWNATADRRVSQLELELQAEVDKYVSARTLLNQPGRPGMQEDLLSVLFTEPGFHGDLSAEELERYGCAFRFAGWYCRSLEARYAAGLPDDAMLNDLRRFYRLPQPDKLSHINVAAYA